MAVNTLALSAENTTIAVFDTAEEALRAMALLASSGFDPAQLSAAAMHDPRSEYAYVKSGDHVRYYGRAAACWREMWGRLTGWAFVSTPGIGPVVVAGPLAAWMVTALDNASLFADLSVVGAALYSMGVPKKDIWCYEVALQSGKVLLIAHGGSSDVSRARQVLQEWAA